MNPNTAPETQFVAQQPIQEVPPQPSVAGIASAQTPEQPFTITGPAQPIQQEAPVAPPPIPPEFLQHPSQPPIAEAQYTQTTTAEVPTTPQFAQEAQVAQPQPVQEAPPSPAPWTETVAPPPTEPVVGLSPEATATPAQQAPSEAAVLNTMEPGNAPIEDIKGNIINTNAPLEAGATQEPVIAGVDTNTDKSAENSNLNYDSLFEKWKDLGPTDLTLQFNSFMSNLRAKGSLDSSIEEGLVRAYSTLLLNKSGLTLEKDLEKKWD